VEAAIVKYYRQLLKTDFENSGSFENASIFIEAVGERMIHCGNSGNYIHLYMMIADNVITDIKYTCSCEPTANVAVEILCTLTTGKTLNEALAVSEEEFYSLAGCRGDELQIKVRGLLKMLHQGIARYKSGDQTTDAALFPRK
jgi:NifU-like protein involved in Fe-S cluster formation